MESSTHSLPSVASMDRTASKDGLEMVSRQNTVTITSNEANYDGNIDVSRELPNRHRASSFVQNMTASQTDKLVRESKALKARIDQLEKENSALKRSLFDLSVQYSAFDQPKQSGKPFIFDLANALKRDSPEEEYADQRSSNDTKTYGFKHDLNGHNGAVYAVQYSPCSKFIASGSIDKTLKLWEMASSQKEIASMRGHALNIMDVHWANDSSRLLSGSYDQTSRVWDLEGSKQIYMASLDGFVQAVMFNPADNNIFFSGTSRNQLVATDIRQQSNVRSMENDAMINSLFAYRDGIHVLTGDSKGILKVWDARTGQTVSQTPNGKADAKSLKAISNIAVSRPNNYDADADSRFISITSYDNIVRFYDRGFEPLKTNLRALHTAKGHKNRNFPIRNSIYQGKEYTGDFTRRKPSLPEDNIGSPGTQASKANDASVVKTLEQSMITAVGSIDSAVYIYDMSGPETLEQPIQRLEGHTDKVFGVSFSNDATLASCSADGLIKIWAPLPAKS